MIPLVDLRAQYEQIADEVRAGFERVFTQSSYVLGPEVQGFEQAFASFMNVRHCIGVANGTDALELAFRAVGVGPGDEVIMPANTFIATALAAARAGATPVLVDVDDEYLLLDPEPTASAITPRTKAIVPVHLYGQMAPMEALERIARDAGVAIIEDAAQAHGARQGERTPGSTGAAAGISFYPSKNLGAAGDAGGVLTNDDAVDRTVRALRNYGSEVKYHHPETGFNSRLDTLQAIVLSAKLKHLARWNEARREAARRYDELLGDLSGVRRVGTMQGNEHVWYLYVVRVANRDEVLRTLNDLGVGAGVHYPVPIHLQGAFASLGKGPGTFPVTETSSDEILSLPIYAEITPSQQEQVVQALEKALG